MRIRQKQQIAVIPVKHTRTNSLLRIRYISAEVDDKTCIGDIENSRQRHLLRYIENPITKTVTPALDLYESYVCGFTRSTPANNVTRLTVFPAGKIDVAVLFRAEY